MRRTRGRNAGEHLVLHQFCNDWISATTDDGKAVMVSPLAVALNDFDEMQRFVDAPNPGTFWQLFELTDDLRFKRRR